MRIEAGHPRCFRCAGEAVALPDVTILQNRKAIIERSIAMAQGVAAAIFARNHEGPAPIEIAIGGAPHRHVGISNVTAHLAPARALKILAGDIPRRRLKPRGFELPSALCVNCRGRKHRRSKNAGDAKPTHLHSQQPLARFPLLCS